MKKIWVAIFLLFSVFHLEAIQSIKGSDSDYLTICQRASKDPVYFKWFRCLPEYAHACEFYDGARFAEHILKNCSDCISLLSDFAKVDRIGSPDLQDYPGLGFFSGSTLRYIAFADHIHKLFDLPSNARIVEIGGGFGGQCAVLSFYRGFGSYTILDLPQVNCLIEKVLDTLSIPNARCADLTSYLTEDNVDLLISNYDFSECSREAQLEYFDKVIKKADRGYITYNQISKPYFGIDSLSPREFYYLLHDAGMNPRVDVELISTHPDNILFTWDRTQ